MGSRKLGPKVVHLVPCDGLGGVETAARSAAENTTLACDLIVYFLSGSSMAQDSRRVLDHPERRLNNPLTYLAAVRDLLAIRPDVLVCSLWRSMLVGMALKRLRPRTKLALFLHFPEGTHRLDRMAQWLAVRSADELWADSQATLDAFRAHARSPIHRVSFVVARRERASGTTNAARFVSWGRLHVQKGHDRSLRLIQQLVSLGVDARLEIWGADCGNEDDLRRLSDSLHLTERVTFAGELQHSHLSEVARQSSFYLGLSRLEGFGMSVVEAMQLGLVPVVTPVGEIRSYVRDDENGLLVDPDSLAVAAERIARLLDSPDEIERLARNASDTWSNAPLYSDDFCSRAIALSRS